MNLGYGIGVLRCYKFIEYFDMGMARSRRAGHPRTFLPWF
jgi:hypothetical protein